MKCVLKIICAIAGIWAAIQLVQLLVDYLYQHYGKRYITSDSLE